jgi:hypothetical protein
MLCLDSLTKVRGSDNHYRAKKTKQGKVFATDRNSNYDSPDRLCAEQ